jgi:hypothetical protein
VKPDLTPRPAYVAFAAVGRLMNAAKPIGRVDMGNELLKAFAFETKIDGIDRETIVAWSETTPTNVETRPAEKLYDYLGREMPRRKDVKLTPAPVFMILPPGGSKRLKIEAAPTKPKWKSGMPNPVVLQLIGKSDWKRSAFQLDESKELRLVAYNFGEKSASGRLTLEGASGAPPYLELDSGDRVEHTIQVNGPGTVTARLELGIDAHALVSARTIVMPAATGPNN